MISPHATAVPNVPYRGINPFRYADHPIFFAREEETRRSASLISVYRGVMLYGDSGSGKSSLINAGLCPSAIRAGFQPERLRLQPRASEEIVVERIKCDDGVGETFLPSAFARDGDAAPHVVLGADEFEEHLAVACSQYRPLLIFDQFEELVTLFEEAGASELQEGLVELLGRLMRGQLPVKVLLSFREDYLGRVKELLAACPELVDQALRLAPPAADSLPTIIRGPFERYPGHFGHELSPMLGAQLVDALAERFAAGDLGLSEVQICCLRLWQSDNPEAVLAERGTRGILEDYLGEAIDGLPPELRPSAVELLSQMVTAAGTRNVISAADVIQRVSDADSKASPKLLEAALDRLSQSKLVRRERRRDLYLYEITSEFLVPWISQRRDEFAQLQARRRERRRLLILAGVSAVLLVVAGVVTGLALWALHQRNHARHEATTATSLALASDAQAALGGRPDVALLLSLRALAPYSASPSAPPEARISMINALAAVRAAGLLGILHGDTDAVTAVAFSPDGRMLASASADDTVRLWNPVTHMQMGSSLVGGGSTVYAVAFSADGRLLASGGGDGSISLWDVATHRQLGPPLQNDGQTVYSVAFSPGGHLLASAGADGRIRVWDLATHRQLGPPLSGHGDAVNAVAFNRSGRLLASAGANDTIRLWDVATHKQFGPTLRGSTDTVYAVAFSPNGRTLVAGGADDKVRLWDVATHKQVEVAPTGPTNTVYSVAFSPNGRMVASAGSDTRIRLWDLHARKTLRVLTGHTDTVWGVAFSPDGRTLASGSGDTTVRLWNVASRGQAGSVLRGHGGAVYGAAVSPSGQMIASGGADKKVRLWSVSSHQLLHELTGHTDAVYAVAFSPTGGILASGGADRTIRLWDVDTGKQLGSPLVGNRDLVYGLAFSPNGRLLASAGGDRTVRLWDVATHKQLGPPLTGHADLVNAVAFSPGGRLLASASADDTIRLWDVASHKQLGPALTGHSDAVDAVAFSPDGKTLASAGADDTIRLWNVATHRQLGDPIVGQADTIYGVAFSPDGRILASAGGDKTVRLWAVATHAPLATLTGHTDAVNSVAFSPDGRTLVSASSDGTIRLWTGFTWRTFDELSAKVCGFVGTGLSGAEWAQYAPGLSYEPNCGGAAR